MEHLQQDFVLEGNSRYQELVAWCARQNPQLVQPWPQYLYFLHLQQEGRLQAQLLENMTPDCAQLANDVAFSLANHATRLLGLDAQAAALDRLFKDYRHQYPHDGKVRWHASLLDFLIHGYSQIAIRMRELRGIAQTFDLWNEIGLPQDPHFLSKDLVAQRQFWWQYYDHAVPRRYTELRAHGLITPAATSRAAAHTEPLFRNLQDCLYFNRPFVLELVPAYHRAHPWIQAAVNQEFDELMNDTEFWDFVARFNQQHYGDFAWEAGAF